MDGKNDAIISVRGLTKRYGDRLVLDHVDFDIAAGSTVALIGPSGGGKSTLLRCLNGLTTIDSGEIRVGDFRFGQARRLSRREATRLRGWCGMVFQDFRLFPHMTVRQNIVEAPLRVSRTTSADALRMADALLERVGMADYAGAYPHQLSGGQQQRVAIARALAMQPRVLLCDEITSALDPVLKMEVLRVLEDLEKDGLTLLVVTHEIGFARRAADRVMVLDEGRIIEQGPPEQVIDAPKSEITRRFLECVLA